MVQALRQPQAAYQFTPALQVGWQGCLLGLPASASDWVSHIHSKRECSQKKANHDQKEINCGIWLLRIVKGLCVAV